MLHVGKINRIIYCFSYAGNRYEFIQKPEMCVLECEECNFSVCCNAQTFNCILGFGGQKGHYLEQDLFFFRGSASFCHRFWEPEYYYDIPPPSHLNCPCLTKELKIIYKFRSNTCKWDFSKIR